MKRIIAAILLLVAIPANAINKADLVACLRGEQPPDVVCPVQ